MAEFGASTGAIWRDMLLAEALVTSAKMSLISQYLPVSFRANEGNDLLKY